MKKNFVKIIIILLLIICISLVGVLFYVKASNNIRKNTTNDLKNKVIDEISFIDSSIIEGMNKLNNISTTRYKIYTKSINESVDNSTSSEESNVLVSEISTINILNDTNEKKDKNKDEKEKENKEDEVNKEKTQEENEINWDDINSIYENLYSIWTTIQIDLNKLKINEEYLDDFNIGLNGVAQSIIVKDKLSCSINFYNLYSQLQNYIIVATDNSNLINLYSTKTAILNAYTLSFNEDKWNEMSSSIKAARNSYFSNIVNNNENNKNVIKVDIMLKNLESAVALNNKNIFYIHYKNTIQELENLEI